MGPFGITQVDVPAALNAYMSGQDRRTQQMQRLRAEEKERIAAENADKTSMAYAKLFAPKGGGQASGGVASAYPTAEATPSPQMGQPAMEPAPQAAPMDDPLFDPQARQEFLSTIATIDGPQALELRGKFMQMDEQQRKQTQDSMKVLGNASLALRRIPPQERAQELQRIAPMLIQLGVDDDMLANADLSDRGLEMVVNQSRDIEKVIDSVTPTVMPVSGVGLFPVTPGSPFPSFDGGSNAAQVNLPRPASAAERDALPEGAQYIAPDGSIMQKGGGGGQSAASGFSEWY